MPKVTQEYRDARRDHIVSAAKRCFLRNGFQATTMQDLLAESQLSSGAFYLYFASKDDVILAIAQENVATVTSVIHELAINPREQGLGGALAAVVETVRNRDQQDELAALTVLVWAEALRIPHLRESIAEAVVSMRSDLTAVVADHQQAGSLPDTVSAAALAGLLISIVPGTILQLAVFGDSAVEGIPDAARAVWPT
ncbi:AcrR family transcriptional regulator [Motilibacter peucedani]|uniref:AcrR family transcriptional regulator n=1 Tax=Motilibacter peucedani TaxID=598650 RepID=A0A420XTB7_9ACTN|nr:TetR/AcrR family transcriptional regulator [Motilibacter peucedani]RKS79919.1 AcrR family transcriptional regulator [Motilibacter peucedani]